MLGLVKRGWHKSQALSALQLYFELEQLKEPLPPPIGSRLKVLTRRDLARGATPIDTAFSYYDERAQGMLASGKTLHDVNFFTVSGRLFELRDKVNFYEEHQEALRSLKEKWSPRT